MEKMIACCGLDCSKCEGYLATQTNDDDKRVEVAKKWSAQHNADIKPEQINCDGCRSDGKKFFYCQILCEIRKCCIEKNAKNCAFCDMYACDRLKKFFEMAPETKEVLEKIKSG
ncbi:MAG: DUF3795 domain-containing protein [Candidatus Omnitrophota bacterium]